jgi:lipoyl(octanoyl) transferase
MTDSYKRIVFEDLGIIDFKIAWDYQEKIFQTIIKSKTGKTTKSSDIGHDPTGHLLFCEHPHVYTLGKSGNEKNLLSDPSQLQSDKASFYKINRGGDITYHGPGQIVGYPILDLEKFGLGVKQYVFQLEEAIIISLRHYNLRGERLKGATGVWLDPEKKGLSRKICAIGVRCSRYVTMHGFAFNVKTNLDYFRKINPCGFTDKSVTSLELETGNALDMEEVKLVLLKSITDVFGITIIKK